MSDIELRDGEAVALRGKVAALESSLTAARSELAACKQELAEARREIEKYAGWNPDQFLRYQEMHKKLQADYVALESANAFLCQERDTLKAELERVTLRWQTGPVPEDGWYMERPTGFAMYHHIKGHIPVSNDKYKRCIAWAGPIPEPQDPEV